MNDVIKKERDLLDLSDQCVSSAGECPGKDSGADIPAGNREMPAVCSFRHGRGKGAYDNRF